MYFGDFSVLDGIDADSGDVREGSVCCGKVLQISCLHALSAPVDDDSVVISHKDLFDGQLLSWEGAVVDLFTVFISLGSAAEVGYGRVKDVYIGV